MEPAFWHRRWEQQQIGFHQTEVHPFLIEYGGRLGLAQAGVHILVPLCGKSLDMLYLAQAGHRVWGIELSEIAVAAFFSENGLQAHVSDDGALRRWQADTVGGSNQTGNIVIWQGDFFALEAEQLAACIAPAQQVDMVYDRAALVALPAEMRQRYVQHLQRLAPAAAHLLIAFDYDQTMHAGPPFSVPEAEIRQLYTQSTGENCSIERLVRSAIDGGLKGRVPAFEEAWLIRATKIAS